MAQTYALKYLAKAAASAPRDLVNAYVARFKAIHPTVIIFHCTFVCDARCEMCSNWQRGDRKSDMTLEQIDRVFASPLWRKVEMAMLSGGEPTTRNDMVEISQVILDRLPRLRKYGINTTGLTPHRAIPMLTKVAELCHERGVIFSTRVSIDGVGEMHNEVRQVKRGFEKANETIRAMQALQKRIPFNFGVSATIFNKNIDDTENILSWAKREKLDIVFNMVRFSDPMLGNADLATTCKPIGREEERMRQFFLERVRMDPLLDGQNYIHLHYADMIGNGYHREAPCPFQTQGIMLNPDGGSVLLREQQGCRERPRRGSGRVVLPGDEPAAPRLDSRRAVPNVPQPLPDERRGREADRAVREIPCSGHAREAARRARQSARGRELRSRLTSSGQRAC